jgi:hypothetical protein
LNPPHQTKLLVRRLAKATRLSRPTLKGGRVPGDGVGGSGADGPRIQPWGGGQTGMSVISPSGAPRRRPNP